MRDTAVLTVAARTLLEHTDSDANTHGKAPVGPAEVYAQRTLARTSSEDRFKRSRQRKKQELAFYRSQVTGLEHSLRALHQQRRDLPHGVWRATSLRQRQQRIEAELLNVQLKTMVHSLVTQTRLLMSMLTFPKEIEPLVDQKRPRWRPILQDVADALELQALLLAVDLVEMHVESTLQRFPIDTQTLTSKRVDGGCGLVVESMDSRLLPYDVPTVSTSVWEFVAFEDPRASSTESTVSRIYTMEIISRGSCVSYQGTYLYRRRVASDGRFVITWASSWTPLSPSDAALDMDFETHESFRREGFVVISALPSDIFSSRVQTFVCVERDACGVPGCDRGAWAHETAWEAEQGVRRCVAGEIKLYTEGMESGVVRQQAARAPRSDPRVGGTAVVDIV